MNIRWSGILILMTVPYLSAFTLLSGPNEATLPVNEDNPTVEFLWDGSTTKVDNQKKYKDGIYADLSEEEFMEVLLNRAFEIWNSVKGSYLQMKVEKDTEASIDADDDKNAIVIKGGVNLSAAAFAQPILSDSKSTIKDCDITISDIKTTAEDLLYTLVHEIGHCVGLGHNHTNYNSIMGYSRMSRMPKLGADDKAGLIYLYPDPAYDSERKEFLACAVVGSKQSNGPIWFFVLPVIALLGMGIYERRVRKANVSK